MSGRKKRRRWTSEEKLRIVLAGLDGSIEISELCRREGINPTQYDGWKKQLLGSASKIFENGTQGRPSGREQRLEAENTRLKSVVVEITAENLDLKKGNDPTCYRRSPPGRCRPTKRRTRRNKRCERTH